MRNLSSAAICKQLRQLWAHQGFVFEKLEAMLTGATSDEARAQLEQDIASALNQPQLLTACAASENTGLNKLISGEQRAAFDRYVSNCADVRSSAAAMAEGCIEDNIPLRSHLVDCLTDGPDADAERLVLFCRGMSVMCEQPAVGLPAGVVQELQSDLDILKAQADTWMKSVAYLAAVKAEESVREDPSNVFTAVKEALLAGQRKGAAIKWSSDVLNDTNKCWHPPPMPKV